MKKIIAAVLILGLGYGLFFTPLGTIIGYKIFPNYPKNTKEELAIKNNREPVKVIFDEYGIPHIEAQNLEDLVRTTGFIQARYRFFQLDILRHFAAGRLSELLGEQPALSSTTVKFDLAMKGWGFEEKTKMDLEKLPELDRKIIVAFSDGVNQGMAKYPSVEHKILGVTPEPWAYEHTLMVGLLQAWSITHNWEQEAVKFALALNLGEEKARKIYPHHPLYNFGTISNKDKKLIKLPPAIVDEVKEFLPANPKEVLERTVKLDSALGDLMELRPAASNAWVVSGERSENGKPILHNDMHLTHSLPSLLFLQHIKMPGLNAIGATMPGLPFLISGYNGKVAWGSTSAVADVVDLVIEKEDPARPGYVLNESRECKIEKKEVAIKIREGDSFKTKTFPMRRTCNGFLFNDMYPDFLGKDAPMVAVRYKIPNVQESFGHLYRANKAQNVFELRENLMNIPSPVQNIMAADMEGNIGFFSTGSVPKRMHHRGTFPIPGWLKKYEWSGWMTKDEMPHAFNPSDHMLANANNLVHNPFKNLPVFHVDAAPEYRFNRIKERILEKSKHTQASLQSIQKDEFSYRAKLVLPYMLEDLKTISSLTGNELKALDYLENWDYNADADSVGMSIFMAVYRKALLMALGNKLNEETRYVFLKQRYSTNIVDIWFKSMLHPVWDDFRTKDQVETRQHVVLAAYRGAINDLEKNLGNEIKNWKWGHLHSLTPSHMFGKKNILKFFNLNRFEMAGGLDTVWKAHFNLSDFQEPFKVVAGPVYRLSIDLADPSKGMFSIDTGESGWPTSPHYGDQFKKWQKGELIPMEYDFDALSKKYGNRVLTINPANS